MDETDRRVIFHIGWPKAGSTSLQQALAGWPNLAGKPPGRHDFPLARAIVEQAVFGEHFTPALLEGLLDHSHHDRSKPVIVSYEACVGLPFTHLRKGHRGRAVVAERLLSTSWEASVLAVVRDARSLLRSSYLHEVKKGSGRTYREFLTGVEGRIDASSVSSWAEALAPYQQRLPDERVTVVVLDDLIRRPAETWDAIAARLRCPDLAALGQASLPHANSSVVAPPWVERMVNRHVLPVARYSGRPVRGWRALARQRAYVPLRGVLASRFSWRTEDHFVGVDDLEDAVAAPIQAAFDALVARHGITITSSP